MEAAAKNLGYLPDGVGKLATSPHLLEGFLKVSAMFEATTLDPLSRETLIMTVSTRNACHFCVAMHTAKLTKLGAAPEVISALRDQKPLPDERLAALQTFALEVLETTGAVGDKALEAFFAHGYTPQNALEVVMGIGVYTMSTLANRMTGAPMEPQLAPFAWEG
jgi:AhpD family alkylhydroperoxidase